MSRREAARTVASCSAPGFPRRADISFFFRSGRAGDRRRPPPAELLLKLRELRFGELPGVTRERLRAARVDELDSWAERVLTAKAIDDVFDAK